jgi:hypothetical protein
MKSAVKKRIKIVCKRDSEIKQLDKKNMMYHVGKTIICNINDNDLSKELLLKIDKLATNNNHILVGTQKLNNPIYMRGQVGRRHKLAKKSGRKKLQLREQTLWKGWVK